jgi:hypothetical protein
VNSFKELFILTFDYAFQVLSYLNLFYFGMIRQVENHLEMKYVLFGKFQRKAALIPTTKHMLLQNHSSHLSF